MGRQTALAGAALLALAGGLAGQEVRSLVFAGNQAIPESDLRAVISTRATECSSLLLAPFCAITGWGRNRAYLDRAELEADVVRLRSYYSLRGYYKATVDSATRSSEVWFIIDEGAPTLIDSFAVRGLPGGVAFGGAWEGTPFDRLRLQAAKDSLARRLRREGYMEARVFEQARRDTARARVALDVEPGPRFRVGEVRVEGGESVGEGLLRDMLPLRPGDFYTQEAEERGQRDLFALEAVRFASIRREPAADSTVDLVVQVTPAEPEVARGGVGWSTDQCLQSETTLTHRNFLGGARRLQLSARIGNVLARQLDGAFPCSDVGSGAAFRTLDYLLEAELRMPPSGFQARLFLERQSIPDVLIQERVGVELGVSRRLAPGLFASLSYAPAYTGYGEQSADIFFCVNYGICAPEDIVTVTRTRWLAPLTLTGVYDGTDDALRPTRGLRLTVDAETAGSFTGSSYRYNRIVAQGSAFAGLEPGLVAAGRVSTGIVRFPGTRIFQAGAPRTDRLVHPSRRFFVGGAETVRGFAQNLFGPRVLVTEACTTKGCVERLAAGDPAVFDERPRGGDAFLVLNLELRRYLGPRWGLVFFSDAGSLSENLTALRKIQWTPGVGVRFASPVGPVRLDVGYNTSSAQDLAVIVTQPNGSLVALDDPVRFDPWRFGAASALLETWRRFQIHVSIGEAF